MAATPRLLRLSRSPLAFATAAALTTGCFSYEDSRELETEDTASEDVSTDATGDTTTVEDVGAEDVGDGSWVVEGLPEYPNVACDTREPVNAPRDGLVWTPEVCGYEVTHQFGFKNIVESCGDAADAPSGLHLTFPNEDAGSNVAVSWMTGPLTQASMVRVGTSPENLNNVFWGMNFDYRELGDEGRIHEVHLCGLDPDTTYYYQAGGEGGWSDVYSFATAPEIGSDTEIVFAATGDSRSDNFEIWGDAVQQMRDLGAEFIVFSGDAVETGGIQSQWDGFFSQGQPGLAEMPIIPCNGNHDLLLSPYLGQFALPNNETNFSVRYGPLHFVSMTDFNPLEQREIGASYAEYMDAAFAANEDAMWSFLVNHRPFYSASTRHGSAEDLQLHWQPIVDRHELDMVFNGHDHNYERSRSIRNGEVVNTGEGTVYTVVAGVGAPLYDNGSQWWTEVSEKTESFAIIRVTPDRLEFTAYRVDGTRLDSLTIER